MYEIRPESVKTFIDDQSIKLPRFQRKQTWDDKKNFQLCISLFKEYPLGVCILNVEKEGTNTTKWLLDGRQRRNALSNFYLDPENIYTWAKKFIGFKNNDQPYVLEEKFWAKINDFLEDEELAEKIEEDKEEIDETDTSKSQDYSESTNTSTLQNAGGKSGLDLLLEIIKLVHNKTAKFSGFTQPFDFTKYVKNNLPYLDSSSGSIKLNSKRIRSFIDSYKIYCRDNIKEYTDVASFKSFFLERFNISDKSVQNQVEAEINQKWTAIFDRISILNKIDTLLMNAKIGLIEVKDLSPVDSQKIFNIINTGGTELTAVEVLSAKPSWNVAISNPSQQQVDVTNALYRTIGTTQYDNVVKWDLPATILKRLTHSPLFFTDFASNKSGFEKELTIGFKMLSGIFRGGITKDDVDKLSKNSNTNWEINYETLIHSLNNMTKVVLEFNYFKYLNSWKLSIVDLLSDACALNYFLLLYKDWKRKGEPIGNNINTRIFQKNALILLDKLIFEYVIREWRGSSDSKIANNIANFDQNPDILQPLEKDKWIKLLDEIFNTNCVYDIEIYSTKTVEPVLYHFYCLKMLAGPDTDCTIEVDHIIPQTIFNSSTINNKNFQHNLFNLGLLPKRENCSKNSKRLVEITDQWLIDKIVKYDFITENEFSLFSDITNLGKLKELRAPIFKEVFDKKRDDIFNN